MASPTKLAHVALVTDDVAGMRDWYATVLESSVAFENDFACFTTYDDEHHRLVFVQPPGFERDEGSAQHLHHIAFTYATLEELLATYERLRDEGIVPWWTINHGPTLSFYYHDPMRNSVELQIDTMSMQDAGKFLESAAFQANPIGVAFDPEDLVARHRAGASFADLVRYEEGAMPAMP